MKSPDSLSTLPYKIKKKVKQWLTDHSSDPRPSSFPYISGDTFRKEAHHIHDSRTTFDAAAVKEGDIVFIQSDLLNTFFQSLHKQIQAPYILVSHNSDQNIDASFFLFIDDKIIHWFAQSLVATHEKVTPIPIGLENAHYHNHGVTSKFENIRKNMPQKTTRILSSFSVRTNPRKRAHTLKILQKLVLADSPATFIPPKYYLDHLAKYKFVASPPGNSTDCHRTWEAMYLRVVPIVIKSPMTEYFKSLNFPMHLINDWQELEHLTESDLDSIYRSLESDFENPYLWMPAWLELFQQ